MPTSPKTILVVDDDVHIVQIVKHKLEHEGYHVVLATNGRFAYQVVTRTDVHLLIADYHMPGGDGIELAKKLRAQPEFSDIPVVMVTANAHRLTPDDLDGTNIHCVLVKPFSPKELVGRVNDLVSAQPDPTAVP